jgi:hypothetical protein
MEHHKPSKWFAPRVLVIIGAAFALHCANNTHPREDLAKDDAATEPPPPPPEDSGTGGGEDVTVDRPKVALPFSVSDEFAPSGFMGYSPEVVAGIKMSKALTDCKTPRPADAVGDCYKASFDAVVASNPVWAGVFWQSPTDNWGKKPGRPIAPGATKVTFYAAGAVGGEKIEFKVGGININGSDSTLPYRDKFQANIPAVTLTTDFQKYEISLEGAQYDEVLGGFCWVTAAAASGNTTFYLDGIRWE